MIPPSATASSSSSNQPQSTANTSTHFAVSPSKEISSSSSSLSSSYTSIDPYYQNKAFYRFLPIAGVYSIIAHLVLILLKQSPLLVRNKFIPTVHQLHPEERFVISLDSTNSNVKHIAIVTGSNTGIGFETASSLVEMGYDVILACRSRDKGEKAAKLINSKTPSSSLPGSTQLGKAVFLHPLDLSSLESVKSFANVFTSKYEHLNILVNNAGINSGGKSIDNLDLCFQTNFVGHYLLTRLLLPHLLKAKNTFKSKIGGIADNGMEAGRVVNLSSVTHHFAGASEERKGDSVPSGTHDEYWWRGCALPSVSENTYKESKMAALLFTQELNNRYGSEGLRAVSANPGSVNSDIWRGYPKFMMKVHGLIYLTSNQGATTSIAAAVGDLPKSAVYLQPYWQPWGKRKLLPKANATSFSDCYSLPVPFTEMMGIYIGYAVTDCRLPPCRSSTAMWNVCEDLVGLKNKEM